METRTCEKTSSGCQRSDEMAVVETENEDETSNVLPHKSESTVATSDARPSGTILEHSISQEDDAAEGDCTYTVSIAETDSSPSLDREAPSLDHSTPASHGTPANRDCSVEIPTGLESDEPCENVVVQTSRTLSAALDLAEERTATTACTRSNMAEHQPGSVSIEMSEITEQNEVENTICEKLSSDTTTIYISEGDNSEVETDLCRICHCGEEAEALISPCLCTGSVKFVHHTCLMSWLQRAVMSKCELCLYPLAVKRKRKPLCKWRLPEDKPFPILWLFTFVVAMTLNIASIAKDGSQQCVSDPCIIFYVLGSAGALLGLAFFYHWLRKTLRYFAKWIALNQEWTLVGPVDLRTQLGESNLAYSSKSLSETDSTQEQIA